MYLSWALKKCRKPDCLRKVKSSVTSCCDPCATADEGRYETTSHSKGCGRRTAERGAWSTREAGFRAQ